MYFVLVWLTMLLRFLTFEDKIKTVNGATIPSDPFDQAFSKIPIKKSSIFNKFVVPSLA